MKASWLPLMTALWVATGRLLTELTLLRLRPPPARSRSLLTTSMRLLVLSWVTTATSGKATGGTAGSRAGVTVTITGALEVWPLLSVTV